MTLLYECLKAVGLQRYYARFGSAGVRCVSHLSGLTMEEYPTLGIRSMEDRTRLFHLVQIVKNIDLESLEDEDDDYNTDGGDEGYVLADSSISHDGDEDAAGSPLNAAGFPKPCVRRHLDFSSEDIDHHQGPFPRPVITAHVSSSHSRNNEPGQRKKSTIPVHQELDTGGALVCSCKGNDDHGLDVHSHQYHHKTGANSRQDTGDRNSFYTSHTRLSPKCDSSLRPKPRHANAASKSFTKTSVGHKDGKGIIEKEERGTKIGCNKASELRFTTPVYESKGTAGYNYGLPLSSPPATRKTKPRGQRISVCVRKRPLTRAECRRREADVVTTPSEECVIVHEGKEAVDLTQYILQHRFYFDQVFGEESTNEEVYQRTARPLVQHVLSGGKATCFAYGQTGAGKTHTMLGSAPGRPGLYALAVQDIFTYLSTTHTHSPMLVYVSFFEIYCGQLYDLLDHRKRLFAREDGHKLIHIAGLRDVRVDSVGSLLEVITQGMEQRTQGTSGVNPLSSRSHALLQIQLRGPNQQIAGRMWFVDLAGSERASDTKEPDRQSRMEGAEINQSLLALKECIRSLDQEQAHTPFRQSKLTQVLKDSFVGDSMTCMIANISPGHFATEHTLNTLRYADRVKELRGQGGLRGGRRDKTIHSPKRNLSNNNSSVGTRGKSPPKKPKLGRQRDAFGPATSTSRSAAGGAILCSTPKNRAWGEDTSARARMEIGLQHITPVRGVLGINNSKERVGRVRGRRSERYGGTESVGQSNGDQNIGVGLLSGHTTNDLLHLSEIQKRAEFFHREKENQQSPLKGVEERERKTIEHRGQVDNSTDTCSRVKRIRERGLQKVDERGQEMKRHLKQYHQQLQQFTPLSASSSLHLFSPSACPSEPSSNPSSLLSSIPPLQSSSLQHTCSLMFNEMEEFLDGQRCLHSFRSGEICLPTESSHNSNNHEGDICCGDSGSNSKDPRIPLEGAKAAYGQDTLKSEKTRSPKIAGQGEKRGRREELRSAGLEQESERRWAWWATTETERQDRVTCVRSADVEAPLSYNSDSEGPDVSDVPAHGMWSSEDRADVSGIISTHSNRCYNSLHNHYPVESPNQRAPAERPLSPACELINAALPLPLQNAREGVASSSCRESEPWFAAHAERTECATLPLTTLITQKSQIQPEINLRMSVLPRGETSRRLESSSSIMDPLSISLLQVDQQVATASFLQGEQNSSSPCPPENERHKQRVAEDEDTEFCLSLLEPPKAKIQCSPTSDTTTASNQSGLRKDMSFDSYEHSGKGMVRLPTAEVMMVSVEVADNKTPASALRTCTSAETSTVQSIPFSTRHPDNTCSPRSQNLMTTGVTQMPPVRPHNEHNKLPFQTTLSESALSQLETLPKQCLTVHLDHCSNSNISVQPNRPTESNHEERPIIHLSTLEDLYRGQWRVVQAHWEQLEEMETLCRKEGMLLSQQPDMAFGEYVFKLGEIMERKAQCVHSMIAQLRPYLNTNPLQSHNQGKNNHNQVT